MANLTLPALTFLLLSTLAAAARQQQPAACQIENIDAQNPSQIIRAEGGVTDFWDNNNNQFRCAGVSIRRHRIQRGGLLLPLYHNAPVLVYAVQGKGKFGLLVSGCPETFESPQQFERPEERRSQSSGDRHQKVEEIRQGDISAVPAGAAHWAFNDGDQELVLVVLHDNGNDANQLDQNPRTFFLAGNPDRGQVEEQGSRRPRQQERFGNNVFRGFNLQTLTETFQIDEETARKLQGQQDQRGHIVTVERGFKVISPTEERSRREERPNGLEETICSAKIKENLDRASRADIYNPRAGRYTTVNSLSLPILSFLKLSAARGVLYKNGIMSPHWYLNAHSVIYVTRGESRMQIVNHRGRAVFDGRVREGQVVVVPQNFAAVKRAGEEGVEWVAFNTNANAMISTLSGRTSAIRGLPADVVANAYQISREEAEKLKFSRRETVILSGSRRSERGDVASA